MSFNLQFFGGRGAEYNGKRYRTLKLLSKSGIYNRRAIMDTPDGIVIQDRGINGLFKTTGYIRDIKVGKVTKKIFFDTKGKKTTLAPSFEKELEKAEEEL